MSDRFENIKSLATQINERKMLVSKKLDELEEELKSNLDGVTIYAVSSSIHIEMIEEDEWRYGHLVFDDNGIQVSSRTTIDDFSDSMNEVPDEYRTQEVTKLAKVKSSWQLRFSDDKVIESLLKDVERNLNNTLSEVDVASSSLERILLSEAHEIDHSVQEVLIDNKPLLRDWVKARASISSDPSDSITRSSSYLESVCRYIIEDSGNKLPDKKVITTLISSALECLQFDSYQEAIADIKQLVGGIKSICSGAGVVRTHVGSAHGSSPGDLEPNAELAMLVNNCAATASSFLLRTYKENLSRTSIKPQPSV